MVERFRFAHLADAHVGAWHNNRAARRALSESVRRALAAVTEEDCDFLVIGGDLFHTPRPDPAEAEPVAAALRELERQGRRVYAIYGSHDYLVHDTSWIDVLSAAGAFVRVAQAVVRTEGERWSLAWVTDPPTGACLAGVPGRPYGYDTESYRGMDSRAFSAAPGFKIFLFHAAVEEFLPERWRGKIPGIPLAALPPGAGYYAGGHIHQTYRGDVGSGVPLVNPGAVFGTNVTDMELLAQGQTLGGLAIVDVEDGRASVRLRRVVDPEAVRLVRVDATGRSPREVEEELKREASRGTAPGSILFVSVSGQLASGDPSEVSWPRISPVGDIVVDAEGLSAPGPPSEPPRTEAELKQELVEELFRRSPPPFPSDLPLEEQRQRLEQALAQLLVLKEEGESEADYARSRRRGFLRAVAPEFDREEP